MDEMVNSYMPASDNRRRSVIFTRRIGGGRLGNYYLWTASAAGEVFEKSFRNTKRF